MKEAAEKLQNIKKAVDEAKPQLARIDGQIESESKVLEQILKTTDIEEAKKLLKNMEQRFKTSQQSFEKSVEEIYNKIDWGF